MKQINSGALSRLFILTFTFFNFSLAHAQQLWGSGYMSTTTNCNKAGSPSVGAGGMSMMSVGGPHVSGAGQGGGRPTQGRSRSSMLQAQLRQLEEKQKSGEQLLDRYRSRIEDYFNPDVSDFLLNTHIESALTCERYRAGLIATACNAQNRQPPSGPFDCSTLIDVPASLANKWNSPNGYCGSSRAGRPSVGATSGRPPAGALRSDQSGGSGSGRRPSGPAPEGFSFPTEIPAGFSTSGRPSGPPSGGESGQPSQVQRSRLLGGEVKDAICEDDSLRSREVLPTPAKIRSCKDSLKKYREHRLAQGDLGDQIEQLRDRIEDAQLEAAETSDFTPPSGSDLSMNGDQTECADCSQQRRGYGYQQNSGRDWTSTISSLLSGITQIYFGRQAERSAQENSAQLGVPSSQSYGYPYYTNGIYGIVNGLTGNSSFSCSPTMLQQNSNVSYNGYGQMNPNFYSNQNMYGNQNMYTNPYGNSNSYTYVNPNYYNNQNLYSNRTIYNGNYSNSLFANSYNTGYTNSNNQLGYYNPYQYNNSQQIYWQNTLNTGTRGR